MVDKKMVEIISKSPLFKDIEEKELQEILSSSIIKAFEKGELVFQDTDKPDGLYCQANWWFVKILFQGKDW